MDKNASNSLIVDDVCMNHNFVSIVNRKCSVHRPASRPLPFYEKKTN